MRFAETRATLVDLRKIRIGLVRAVSVSTLAAAIFLALPAHAEEQLIEGQVGLGTGMEGGDSQGTMAWRRARARVVAGVDLRTDEDEAEGLGFRVFAEVEKRATVGGEARYEYWPSHGIGAYGGLIGTFAPETLFGAGVGVTLVVPMGRRAGIFIEPSFSALPLGSDLPGKNVLVWGLLSAGLRLGL